MEQYKGFDPKDILTWKISEDPAYQEKILNDFEFAKQEFSNAGISLDHNRYENLQKAYRDLEGATKDILGPAMKLRWVSIAPPAIE